MTTYFKAVRPDGTDFWSGTVQWLPKTRPLGRTRIVRHPTSTVAVRGEHGTSFAVSTDPTRLPGAGWPLRLCEVEPLDGAAVIETDQYKRQAVAWRVVREIEPHLRFGPMGVHVASLIERARTLTLDEALALGTAWEAAWDAAWFAAREAAREAAIALTIRDLVGQHGFTKQHYDTLTMPWRSVIGRIHPDDAEVTR